MAARKQIGAGSEAGDGDPKSQAGKSQAEQKAEMMIRRQKRNMRKAWAEGYLTGICAMLQPGDLAVDCGANMGVVTTQLAATGADVIAFEPDPDCFAVLEQKFGSAANVTLINAAVGISAGTVRLMRAGNFDANPVGASVKNTILDGGRGIDAGNSVEVPLIDFPAFLREKGQISFLKLDIEGAELDILETMERDGLFGSVKSLVAETHERKFPDLRPRFRDLRRRVAGQYPPTHVNLDWI
ncbi:FkbM family methyltransferase [Pseudogemmobacter bohemicus]|uniref:FkbM family methyltransferase n=1 Tax=Pseudogemmobacter bohemicus TaxID=2250708 RepID=UPI001E5409B6|nr:FkbM family methyltransferase [Pseudogemmobacter bohemicus]